VINTPSYPVSYCVMCHYPTWECQCNRGLPDSGKRRHFPTGSQRDTREGKGRFDLLPPLFLILLAKHFERGGAKYEDRNWEKGQPMSTYLDSALRHLVKYTWYGADNEDHLVAAAWNLAAMVETRERAKLGVLPKELADVPIPRGGGVLKHDVFEEGGL